MSLFIQTVKTASGATAVQIVYSHRQGHRELKQVGSAHTDEELALLKAKARLEGSAEGLGDI